MTHDPSYAYIDLRAIEEERRREREDRKAWFKAALTLVRMLPPGWRGTGEDIRLHLTECGFRPPQSANAWGMVIAKSVQDGVLHPTPEMRAMRVKTSHGRTTRVYERRTGVNP